MNFYLPSSLAGDADNECSSEETVSKGRSCSTTARVARPSKARRRIEQLFERFQRAAQDIIQTASVSPEPSVIEFLLEKQPYIQNLVDKWTCYSPNSTVASSSTKVDPSRQHADSDVNMGHPTPPPTVITAEHPPPRSQTPQLQEDTSDRWYSSFCERIDSLVASIKDTTIPAWDGVQGLSMRCRDSANAASPHPDLFTMLNTYRSLIVS